MENNLELIGMTSLPPQSNALSFQSDAQAMKLQDLQRQYLHPQNTDQRKLKKAAQEFEGIFVQQMLDAMDKTIQREDSFLSGGSAEQYFRSMLNEEIAKSMTTKAGGSGFGLAETIYKQMAKNADQKTEDPSAATALKPQ